MKPIRPVSRLVPLVFLVVAAGPSLAQSPQEAPAPAVRSECGALMNAGADKGSCSDRLSPTPPQGDAGKLLTQQPTAAGKPAPLTRAQVIRELQRARAAGELDGARYELGF